MKEFDYIIIGGGCAGLSLAYELDLHLKLKDKTLAIVEPRDEYKKDKTWSFWKVSTHNFEDCTKKSWDNFTINIPSHLKHINCKTLTEINLTKFNTFVKKSSQMFDVIVNFKLQLENKLAQITKLFRPRFKKTLVLVKPRFKKYRPSLKHNRTSIIKTLG